MSLCCCAATTGDVIYKHVTGIIVESEPCPYPALEVTDQRLTGDIPVVQKLG